MRTDAELITLIKELSNANGVSGFEEEVAAIGRKEAPKGWKATTDSLLNTYFSPVKKQEKKPLVWLDAHSDEVGFIVQAIRPEGTMHFLNLGGCDVASLPTNAVRIRNQEGEYIKGIISSKPPHFMTAEERVRPKEMSSMTLDVGARSKEELEKEFKIAMAAPVVPDVECTYDEKRDLFMGKAFDCRVGCAALLETLQRLPMKELEVDVIGTMTVQEEVGERGSMAAVDEIDADVCICFEGCPADDTFSPSFMIQAGIGRGPMLRHFDCSMITNPRFQRFCLDVARKENIPVQESVRSGGGTNGKYIHASRHGVPTVVIGIPVRYIHSPHGICKKEDVLHAISLAEAIIKNLDEKTIQSF